MAKAIWNDQVIAESEATVKVDGNHYFPLDSLNQDFFTDSPTTSVCPWKGTANYMTIQVNGQDNPDAAWIYRDTKPEAKNIENHVAFWKGVRVE